MSKTMVTPLVYTSEEELKMLLYKGIFVNEGKTWFCLNKNGEHCIMISAAECLIPIHSVVPDYANYDGKISRFVVDFYTPFCSEFKTHVKTQFLSPRITYKLNLVFNFANIKDGYLGLNYLLAGETKSSTCYLAEKREGGWLMAELYELTSERRNVDFHITFRCQEPFIGSKRHRVSALGESKQTNMGLFIYITMFFMFNYDVSRKIRGKNISILFSCGVK